MENGEWFLLAQRQGVVSCWGIAPKLSRIDQNFAMPRAGEAAASQQQHFESGRVEGSGRTEISERQMRR